jgi:hypothetical protein
LLPPLTRICPTPGGSELGRVLDEELRQLSEKYRAPVVLCYLEGLTNEEAARHLGCPVGTLKTRLARARELLAGRLRRRGLVVGAGLLSGGLLIPAAQVSAGQVSRAARAAVLIISGQGVAGVVSAPVATLTEGVMRAMTTVKARLLAATLAAGLAVAGTGVVSYRGLLAEPVASPPTDPAARVEQIKGQIAALQEELRQAEQEAARQKAEGPPPKTVAVIFGDVPITRDELARHLLARLRPEQLEAYINRRILEHACRREGITVTDLEVDAAVKVELKGFGEKEQAFAAMLGQKFHKTLLEWKEDVVRPRLLMTKLCRRRVRVTEKDLRSAFEARYGEKVECQVILWPPGQKQEAQRETEAILRDEARFERKAGTQPNATLALTNGRMKPFGRHGTDNEKLEKAAFRLKAGEISPLVDTPEGLLLIKCLQRLPADSGVDFEKVREGLREEVHQSLLQKEQPRMMEQLKEQARPRLLWRPRAAGEGAPSHAGGK